MRRINITSNLSGEIIAVVHEVFLRLREGSIKERASVQGKLLPAVLATLNLLSMNNINIISSNKIPVVILHFC